MLSGPDDASKELASDNKSENENGLGSIKSNNNGIPKKKIHIMVLGETGIGKSTFLNSTLVYLAHNSLSKALECQDKESLYKISSMINIWGKNNKQYNFQVGQFDRDIKHGESVTKLCTTYTVELEDMIIHFTDTPGIGDTGGVVADAENFEKILNELSEIKELHGILILLSPNTERLTITFKYVINELFTRLHESARNNVFFCFTKTRGTMFKPGSSLSILETHLGTLKLKTGIEILTKNRYFCLDNEAFSYLMAKKFTDAEFDENDEKCYSTSWDISSKTIYQIIDAVSKVAPHQVSDSICINNARAMINKARLPLMQCIDNVIKTIKDSERLNNLLKESEGNFDDLTKELYKKVTYQKSSPLPRPYIFCNYPECLNIKNYTILEQGTVIGHICERDDETLNLESWLYFRKSMNLMGNCRKCTHSLNYHRIEINAQFLEEIKVEDASVREKLDKEEKNISLKNSSIKSINDQLYELQHNKNVLSWAIFKFLLFLKNHSLVPVNQDYKDYIQEAMDKEVESYNKSLENSLIEDYDFYVKEINQIKENQTIISPPTPKEVFEIIEKIKGLKLAGSLFEKAMVLQRKRESNINNTISTSISTSVSSLIIN